MSSTKAKEMLIMTENNNTFMNTEMEGNTNMAMQNTQYWEMTERLPAQVSPEAAPVSKPAKTKKRGAGRIVALALGCSLLGGAIGAGGVAAYDNWFRNNTVAESQAGDDSSEILVGKRDSASVKMTAISMEKELSAADIYEANVNATVGITTSVTTNYWGYQTTSAASGSGFILTADGYIVTNYHVVEDASSIKVTTYDNSSYTAKLVGYDENNDLAVLKIEAKGLQTVVLGDSDKLRVGDSVVAIGNPLGELTFSLTHGAVSALNRKITISNNAMTLIQTDCAINSGNSGGALFNAYGEVIGITNAKYSGSGSSGTASIDNVGFAIPINSVATLIKSIIEDGYIDKPYIGVTIYDLDSQYQAFGLSGVAVESVENGSPAAQAGLKANDVITKVDGKEISGTDELISIVSACKDGDVLTLTVYRQGETTEIKVTVAVKRQTFLPEEKKSSESGKSQNGQGQQNPYGRQGQNGQQGGQSGSNPFGSGTFPFSDDSFPFSQGETQDSENGFPFSGGSFGY